MRLLDVGGGLGVDYDGTASTRESSINYTVREYANTVIATISDVCRETSTPHPDIVTESGRSMVAHHAVLLVEVIGRSSNERTPLPVLKTPRP